MKRIGIMIGSDSDLAQCLEGLAYLKRAEQSGAAKVIAVITNSIHRNTEEVLKNLNLYTPQIDVWIIGAGNANHLTGTCDAYIRHHLKNDIVAVVGVPFEDKSKPDNTIAARLGITHVPGTQVITTGKGMAGEKAFYAASIYAVMGAWPKFVLNEPKPVAIRTLDEALAEAQKRRVQ